MALTYVGNGSYIHGIPARNLTDAEEKEFKRIILDQEKLTGIKLYETRPASKASKDDGGSE